MSITAEEKEYELIPVSPIRRLEKRLERLESTSTGISTDVFKDMIDIMRMNQQIVDELARSNDALRIELSKLPGKLDELISQMKELISFIKSSGEEETVGITQEAMKPVVDKLDELIKSNKAMSERNESLLEVLDEIRKGLRRPVRPLGTTPLLKRPQQIERPTIKV